MNKSIEVIPEEVVEVLKLHDWPGNIRELQNFIERSVVLSPGTTLRPRLAELHMTKQPSAAEAARTLAEAERDHIMEVLQETNWLVGGRDGAAVRLGLPRTSLIHKMHKLGIEQQGRRPRGARKNAAHANSLMPPLVTVWRLGVPLLLGGEFLHQASLEWYRLIAEHHLTIGTNFFGTTVWRLSHAVA